MNSVQSAVLWPDDNTLSVETVELENPREGEVLVKVAASGICHTDMVLRDAGMTRRPVVLGHEGAGIVEKIGPGVTGFQPGDRVVMSFSTCGGCPSCLQDAPAYCHQFFPLNFAGSRPDGSTSLRQGEQVIQSHIFGQSSFSTHAVCPQRNLVKIDDSTPLNIAAPFGCGFQTGAGAVLNSLEVGEGSSVMVLGAGAVGLSAVMAAAHIARAATVVSVDLHDSRLDKAMEVGATHTLNGVSEEFADTVRNICPRGVDYIIDTTSFVPMVERCIDLLAIQGTLGLVAAYPHQSKLSFDLNGFMTAGKRIRGVMEGDSDIQGFIPQLLAHYQENRFPVDKIIQHYDFSDINRAIDDSECGTTIKAVVVMPD